MGLDHGPRKGPVCVASSEVEAGKLPTMTETTCIYLDLDGCVVDFHSATLRLFGVDPLHTDQIVNWDAMPGLISLVTGKEIGPHEFWRAIDHKGADFWSHLPWLPWGRQLVSLCERLRPTALVTSAAGPASAAGKIQWIARELPAVWHKRYALTTIKHHFAHPGALLVDDAQHNCDDFRAHGGQAFLWPAPWNSKREEYLADRSCVGALAELEAVLAPEVG
jgi:hypothetical protein